MSDNGELKNQKADEIKSSVETPNLGKAETPNLGSAGNLPKEEVKPEQKAQEPPADFKVAEIWIRSGQLILDASPEFWMDKLRALGVLEMCKDIVKDFKQEKPRIITNTKNPMLNFARSFRNKFRKK